MDNRKGKHRQHKKENYYWQLPRRKQRDNFIRLRQKIRNHSSVYGGQFVSHQILDEPGRLALYNQWADAYFLGSDGLTIWNTTFSTSVSEFWSVVEDIAFKQAWQMLTHEEQSAESEIKLKPIWVKGKRMFQWTDKPKLTYEKFGGLTFKDYQEKVAEEIIKADPPDIFESFVIDRTYCYGIGLNVVINVAEINRITIEEAIRRFREEGETDWKAAEPVPRSELPMETKTSAFSRIQWESKE